MSGEGVIAAYLAPVGQPRWKATVTYRTDHGQVDVTHDLCEIDELDAYVERGPHWDTIIDIRIVRAINPPSTLTVEEARKL